jgi:hypothetical protein
MRRTIRDFSGEGGRATVAGSAASGSLVADLLGESDMAYTVISEAIGEQVHENSSFRSWGGCYGTTFANSSHMETQPRQNAPTTRLVAASMLR